MEEEVIRRVRRHWPLIEEQARAWKLRLALLAGLVAVESGGDPLAERYEPGYRWLWGDEAHETPRPRPPAMSQASYLEGQKWSRGLCQIMVATARQLGFAGWPCQLHEPSLGLHYGARYLRWCLSRYEKGHPDPEHWGLLRYNGGGDPGYPDRVRAWAARFAETERKEKEHV